MRIEIYARQSSKVKKIGFTNNGRLGEEILDELVRVFSLRARLLKSFSSLILYDGKECAILDKKTIFSILAPLADAVNKVRVSAVFNNKAYDALENLLNGNLDFIKKMRLLPKNFSFDQNRELLRYINLEKIPGKRKRKNSIRDSYEVYCYNVDILDTKTLESFYRVRIFSECVDVKLSYMSLGSLLVEYDRRYFFKKIAIAHFDDILDHRLSLFHGIAQSFCPDVLSRITKRELKKLAYLSFFSSIKVTRVMPFLLDDYVQEFFQDAPSTKIYLDHEKYGRCLSNIALSPRELEAFLTHIKIDTGSFISFSSPSLKTDYITCLFRVRVAVDVPPLAVDGVALDVRKYRNKPMTLVDIVNSGTLTADAAAFLLIAAIFRSNILICGEPGSGKTTLLNALDMLLPRTFRKVYIEDVVESVNQLKEGKHQLRLKVGAFEESEWGPSSKAIEIVKMLHRKPDYLILGELQSREHVVAAFHAMNAGLRCMQTTHALSLEQLIYRYTEVFSISPSLLKSLDLIVFMRRDLYRRDKKEVSLILERAASIEEKYPLRWFHPLFIRQSDNVLKRTLAYENSRLIEKISIENRFSKTQVILLIKRIRELLNSKNLKGIRLCLNEFLARCKSEI